MERPVYNCSKGLVMGVVTRRERSVKGSEMKEKGHGAVR
jgi:hypothetical protein